MQESKFFAMRGAPIHGRPITGYIEMFPMRVAGGEIRYVTIPGASRHLGPDDGWLLDDNGQLIEGAFWAEVV